MNLPDTVFVLVSDENYFPKARQTITDLRVKGKWLGEIVLITIDFNLDDNCKDYYEITEVKIPPIDKNRLIILLTEGGFPESDKKRDKSYQSMGKTASIR